MSAAFSPPSFFASQRVSVMYVCFGFSVTRLRRARTNDLLAYVEQGRMTCNVSRSLSLSLLSFFASQRVSVGAPNRRELCRSLTNSRAKSIENHRENQSKIDPRRRLGAPKIDSKSLPGPSRDTSWRPRASRRRLGSVLGRPRRAPGAPKESLRAPRNVRKGALEHSGAR